MKMDNILSFFDNIDIVYMNRVSEADRAFCEQLENNYKCSHVALIRAKNEIEAAECSMKSPYPSFYGGYKGYADFLKELSDTLKERINKIRNDFIYALTGYFQRTYNIRLSAEDTINDLSSNNKMPEELTAEWILKTFVFDKLDGMSFNERAIEELKNDCRNIFSGWRKENICLKKNTLEIADFFYIDHIHKKYFQKVKIDYDSYSIFSGFMTALSYFETGAQENIYKQFMNAVYNGENDEIITTHDLKNIKAKSIRLYQNGKIILKFTSAEYCMQFAREYCGYAERKPEE